MDWVLKAQSFVTQGKCLNAVNSSVNSAWVTLNIIILIPHSKYLLALGITIVKSVWGIEIHNFFFFF